MVTKIARKLRTAYSSVEAYAFRNILKRNKVEFYFRDRFGVLSRRDKNNNIEYIFKTKNSYDAAPLMDALKDMRFDVSFDVGANIFVQNKRRCHERGHGNDFHEEFLDRPWKI